MFQARVDLERWKSLVLKKHRNVEYLADDWASVCPVGSTILYEAYRTERFELLKWALSLKFSPILRTGVIDFSQVEQFRTGIDILSQRLENVTCHNPSLEMLAISNFFSRDQSQLLKQFYITGCNISDFALLPRVILIDIRCWLNVTENTTGTVDFIIVQLQRRLRTTYEWPHSMWYGDDLRIGGGFESKIQVVKLAE
uniref:Uncharacterized protein n=1 Tax=Tetranychus urticae TaxID=32264 RepID=T1JQ26_TETUR